jgi:PhzF family phenazine biosynthesis protein
MFQLVDVFGSGPYLGNPLAVLQLDADAPTEELQALTRWMNHSETAFVLPPTKAGADYRVRIFTLDRELPFAGHPSLGSCHAWVRWSGSTKRELVQECGLGLVPMRREEGRFAFRAPPLLRSGPVDAVTLARVLEALALKADKVLASAWVDNGPGWVGLQLRDAAAVLAVQPLGQLDARLDVGLVGAHPPGGELQFELRAFFTNEAHRVLEDPVTGSLNASVGQWLFERGLARARYLARQGTCIGRRGLIHVSQDAGGEVWVGGPVETYAEGTFPLRSGAKQGRP